MMLCIANRMPTERGLLSFDDIFPFSVINMQKVIRFVSNGCEKSAKLNILFRYANIILTMRKTACYTI